MKKLIAGVFIIANISVSIVFASAAEDVVVVSTEAAVVEPVAVNKLSEDQIPINIDQDKKPIEAQTTSGKLVLTGLVVSLMLAMAYYFVRKYKTSNKINKSNMQIKVLSQHYLGPKKSLAIVRVAGESVLIGVTDTNISMIKSLALLDEDIPTTEIPQSFVETMKESNPQTLAKIEELEEEFSFSTVKDSVSKKLKSMRSLREL